MKPKFTMALAVLAVVLMLGSALVPIGFNNDDGSEPAAAIYETTQSEAVSGIISDSGSSAYSTSDIYSLLSTLMPATISTSSLGYTSSYVGSILLVPVDNDTDYEHMAKWDGKDVTDSKTVGLYGGHAATITTSTVKVESGSTFVLFPTAVTNDVDFTVTGVSSGSSLYLMSGSYLDIFGLKFKIAGDDNENITLFEVANKFSVTLKTSGIFMKLGAKAWFEIYGTKLMNNSDADETESDASLKLTAQNISSSKNKFSARDIGITIDSETSTYNSTGKVDQPMNISETTTLDSIKMEYSSSDGKGKIEAEIGKQTSDLKVSYYEGENETVVIDATKLTTPVTKFSYAVEATYETVDGKKALSYSLAIKASMDGEESAYSIGYADVATVKGIKSSIDSIEMYSSSDATTKKSTFGYKLDGEASFSIDSIDMSMALNTSGDDPIPSVSVKSLSASIKDTSMDYTVVDSKYETTMSIASMKFGFESLTYGTDDGTELSLSGLALEIKDTSLTAKGTTVSMTEDTSLEMTASIGSIDLKGELSYPSKIKYPLSVDLEGTELSISSKDTISASAGKLYFKVSTKYDGMDRSIEAEVKTVSYNTEKQKVANEDVTVTKIKAENIEASCNVPFAKMWPEGFKYETGTASMTFYLPNIDMDLEGKNIYYEYGGANTVGTADLLKIEGKSVMGSTMPYLESMMVEGEGLALGNDNITADSISGYVKNYGESKENYKIEKKGDDKVTLSMDIIQGTISITKGSAEFSAGFFPFSISVGKDASFKADGLSAPNFYFEKGASLSGTVALDTAEYYTSESRVIKQGDVSMIALNPLEGKGLASAGYKLTYDIGTMTSGTLTACKGTTMPEWKAEYGQQWTRSDDNMSATFTVPETGASFKFETAANSYTFAYDGSEPVTKKYGESITLDEVPAKVGFKALGWSDGSEEIFFAGLDYKMPARDVVLKAVYADAAPTENVDDKEVSIETDSAPSIIVTKETISKVKDGGSLTIKVDGGKIKMDKSTIDGLKKEKGDDINIVLAVTKADEINDDVKQKIVGNGTLYNIKLVTDNGDEFSYSESETFEVSLNVKVSGKVDHFKITYLGDNYETHEVGVSGFSQSGDNDCTVTFDCNHFSDYIIEPVYKSTNWGLIIAIIVIAVLVLAAVVFLVIRSRSKTKAI